MEAHYEASMRALWRQEMKSHYTWDIRYMDDSTGLWSQWKLNSFNMVLVFTSNCILLLDKNTLILYVICVSYFRVLICNWLWFAAVLQKAAIYGRTLPVTTSGKLPCLISSNTAPCKLGLSQLPWKSAGCQSTWYSFCSLLELLLIRLSGNLKQYQSCIEVI